MIEKKLICINIWDYELTLLEKNNNVNFPEWGFIYHTIEIWIKNSNSDIHFYFNLLKQIFYSKNLKEFLFLFDKKYPNTINISTSNFLNLKRSFSDSTHVLNLKIFNTNILNLNGNIDAASYIFENETNMLYQENLYDICGFVICFDNIQYIIESESKFKNSKYIYYKINYMKIDKDEWLKNSKVKQNIRINKIKNLNAIL